MAPMLDTSVAFNADFRVRKKREMLLELRPRVGPASLCFALHGDELASFVETSCGDRREQSYSALGVS